MRESISVTLKIYTPKSPPSHPEDRNTERYCNTENSFMMVSWEYKVSAPLKKSNLDDCFSFGEKRIGSL